MWALKANRNAFVFRHGGNLFNGTYAFYPMKTHGRNTAGVGEVTVLRDGDKFPIMPSGNIKTFLDNAGAYTGEGVLLEEEATNIHPNPSSLELWDKLNVGSALLPVVTPNYALAPDGTMTATRVQLSLGGGVTSGDFCRLQEDVEFLTTDSIQSFYVKSNDANNYSCGHLMRSESVANFDATQQWEMVAQTNISTPGISTDGIQLRGARGQSATADILIWSAPSQGFQTTAGSYTSSFIGGSGAPATRADDFATVPSSDVYVDASKDNPFTIDDYNLGAYVHGIYAPSSTSVSMRIADGGKYDRWFRNNTDVYGAIITASNGLVVKLASDNGFGTNVAMLVRNPTGLSFADACDALQYPNPLTIDFSNGTIPLADMHTGRADVGDLPPTKLPLSVTLTPNNSGVTVNDNIITIDGTYSAENAVLVDVSSTAINEIKSTDIIYYELDYTVNSGAGVVTLLGQTLTAGINKISLSLPSNTPLPLSTALINVDGTIDCEINITEKTIRRWLDSPIHDNTFKLTFTPWGLTGEGTPLFFIESEDDDYVLKIVPNDYSAGDFVFTYTKGIIDVDVTVNVSGGIIDGTAYALEIGYDDSNVIATVDGDTETETNVHAEQTVAWKSVAHLGGETSTTVNGLYSEFGAEDRV